MAAAGQAAPPAAHPVHRRRAAAPDPEKDALRKRLAEATANIAALDSRVLELMGQTASLRQDLEARAASEAALQQKLEAATRSAAELQARLQTAEEQRAKLAAEREKLAAPQAPRTPPPADARLEAQLQDITRRRDALITSVLRRYRELANEYRSFGTATVASNDRDLAKTGPDLTRIQNTIAMAEEDLRQLNGLEAQADLVRKSQAKNRTP